MADIDKLITLPGVKTQKQLLIRILILCFSATAAMPLQGVSKLMQIMLTFLFLADKYSKIKKNKIH